MTEEQLVQLCQEGDRAAQQELFAQTSERIYRLLLKMTGQPDDALDLAQETYLKAFAQIQRFDGRSSISTWLYRIAVNEALQFLRRVRSSRRYHQDVGRHAATKASKPDVTRRLDVQNALTQLAPLDHALVLLRYQEGLDYRGIAHVMGCAEGTVASRLNRARQRLGEILGESYAKTEEKPRRKHPKKVRKKR